jgi:predicted lipid carrier protein YhbT
VATLEECRSALDRLAATMGGMDPEHTGLQRTLSCHVTDLATTFSGELQDGRLRDITTEARPKAQIRLHTTSDDLVALTSGRLGAGKAWASGRLKVEASMRDLLRLRSIF